MKIKALDIAVPLVGALTFLFALIQLPVWALFIGWAWYYAFGAQPGAFKTALPPTFLGAAMAILCFIMIDIMAPAVPAIPATMIGLFVTLFILMMVLKIPAFSASLPAFNAYSCFFVGFAYKTYMEVQGMPPLLNGLIWITGANILGLVAGWVSIEVEKGLKKVMKE